MHESAYSWTELLNAPVQDQKRATDIEMLTANLIDGIDDEQRDEIGRYVVDIYAEDLESRSKWEKNNERWLKLASQLIEKKSFPWNNASNVKYPLLSYTALQFHARAYSALIPNDNVVKARVVGRNAGTEMTKIAQAVAHHMSYQVLYEMEDWTEEFDRALYILPIIGLVYKKSYYDPSENTNASDLVLPDDLVINYHATSFKNAIKTHRMPQTANEIRELMNMDYYSSVELPSAPHKAHEGAEDEITGTSMPMRSKQETINMDDDASAQRAYSDVPYEILEAHTWWDLDGDGYKEPYVITVEKSTRKVLRMVARYRSEDVMFDGEGNIMKITAYEYFTQFGFLPNPESKIYYQGMGQLLGPLNAASNTILNQLINAGTLATMPGGFIGRGMKLRGGEIRFSPGQWKHVPIQGDDIRKNIFPLPYKEPSSVLFQLLGLVIESAEKLSSVGDMMLGENPGQNQPYATSVMVLEQGMKVFSGIYRRIFRALDKEFKKLYELNKLFVDDNRYFSLMGTDGQQIEGGISPSVYQADVKVLPGADPSIISESHRIMKANSLLQKLAAGLPLNPTLVTQQVLEAEGHENVKALMELPPPQPPLELQMKEMELASKENIEIAKLRLDADTKQFESLKDFAQAMVNLAKADEIKDNGLRQEVISMAKMAVDEYKAITERARANQEIQSKQQEQQQKPDEIEEEEPKEAE